MVGDFSSTIENLITTFLLVYASLLWGLTYLITSNIVFNLNPPKKPEGDPTLIYIVTSS